MALTAAFKAELGSVFISDVFDVEKQRVVQAAGAGVFDGDIAVDAVPGAADELEGDVFGDVDRAIGQDDDFGEELFEVAFLRRGRYGKSDQHQENAREQGEPTSECGAHGHGM